MRACARLRRPCPRSSPVLESLAPPGGHLRRRVTDTIYFDDGRARPRRRDPPGRSAGSRPIFRRAPRRPSTITCRDSRPRRLRRGRPTARLDAPRRRRHSRARGRHHSRLFLAAHGVPPTRRPAAGRPAALRFSPAISSARQQPSRRNSAEKPTPLLPPFPLPAVPESSRRVLSKGRRDPFANFENGGRGTFGGEKEATDAALRRDAIPRPP